MVENKKQLIENLNKTAKYGIYLLGGIIIYIVGRTTYAITSDAFNYSKEYTNLNNKKNELVRKVDELQRFTPLMREQFATQYKDSLENAVRDTSEINLRIAKIKEKQDKIADKTDYSWLAFFMKD